MKKIISNYFLVLIFLVCGCSTSKKSSFENSQEQYYFKALTNLKKGKSFKKNKDLLISSLNSILTSKTARKDSLVESQLLENKEKGFEIIELLYAKLNESREFSNGYFDAQIINIKNERKELKKYLKDAFYKKGFLDFEKAKKNQDKHLSRKAFSSFNKSKKLGNEDLNSLIQECSKLSTINYHVRANTTEGVKQQILIDNQFKKLEHLELPFVNIFYKNKNPIQYDCEIDIQFDELTIKDEKSSKNKQYSKEVRGHQTDSTTTFSTTIRGYVNQQLKKRKLNWKIITEVNSDFNNCQLENSTFKERFVSRTRNITLSGNEDAIPKKLKQYVADPLPTKSKMVEDAIIRVYKKIEQQLKSSLQTKTKSI